MLQLPRFQDVLDALRERNHTVEVVPSHFYFGLATAVADACSKCTENVWSCDFRCLYASADWRGQVFNEDVKAPMPGGF